MKIKRLLFGVFLLSSLMFEIDTIGLAETLDTSKGETVFEIVPSASAETLIIETNSLEFGTQAISPTTSNIKAKNDFSIKITEFSGLKPGWTLQVQMSPFLNDVNETQGMQLFYPNVNPVTTTGGEAGNNPPKSDGKDSSFFDENVKGTIVKDDNIPVTLLDAGAGKGFGEWLFNYDEKNNAHVQLMIPSGQIVGEYKSTLTYSVRDTPRF